MIKEENCMNSIFLKEEEVLKKSISIAETIIETDKDKELYINLVEDYRELLEQMKRMIRMSDIIENKLNYVRLSIDEISKIDFVTNMYNRRYFNKVFMEEWKKGKKDENSIAVIMIDIDKFKEYNDIYGHVKGDQCLEVIADEIKQVIEKTNNIASRYGGEEFICLIKNADLNKAESIAEMIRENIEALNIKHKGSPKYNIVTVSIGIAAVKPIAELIPEIIINMADEALYRAKNSGRNKVSI
jgi:diguanylate cyclase (GGDEF)-like protein